MSNSFQRSNKDKNGGFTLIEVIIALLLFSVSMMGLGALQLKSMKSVTKASTITEATALAHSQIELLKGLSIDHANVTGNSVITPNGSFWTQRIVTNDSPLGTRIVDTATGVAITVCKTIEIKVFEDSAGSKLLASTSFIKSHAAVE